MNWESFPKGSFNPECDNLSFGITGRDLHADMYLDGEISLTEYTGCISDRSIIFEAQVLNEFDMGDIKDILLDILQVAGGAGAIVGTGGFGGDTVTDAIVAVEASSSAMEAISDVVAGADAISDIVDGVLKINLASGMDGIYAAVRQVLRAAAKGFEAAAEGLAKIKEGILDLIGKALRGVEKWISTIIPDDAGTVGIVIRETVQYMIEKAAANVYDLLKGAIGKIPDAAKKLIFSSKDLGRFLHSIVNSVIDFIADVLKERKEKGLIGKAIDVAKFATNPLLSIATSDKALVMLRNYLIKNIKPKIPLAVKAARFMFTLFFGLVAAFQLIVSEDYLDASEKKTVAMTSDEAPTVAMASDDAPTVAMARATNERIEKWQNYDISRPKIKETISVKEMIVIKGDEKWGIRAAIKNISEGRKSRSKGQPIQVTWILAEDKFLITDGYHRLVEGLMRGNKEFICEVDWSGCSLKWKVPRADNRFIVEALKKIS